MKGEEPFDFLGLKEHLMNEHRWYERKEGEVLNWWAITAIYDLEEYAKMGLEQIEIEKEFVLNKFLYSALTRAEYVKLDDLCAYNIMDVAFFLYLSTINKLEKISLAKNKKKKKQNKGYILCFQFDNFVGLIAPYYTSTAYQSSYMGAEGTCIYCFTDASISCIGQEVYEDISIAEKK